MEYILNKVIGIGKKVLPFCLFTFLPLNMQAQRLAITRTTIDVGRTGYCIPVTATFELRNKGLMRKLQIKDVKPDCSCTKVEFPKGEIGIGDKFTIKMTYDARMLGHFNKQAAIISNGSKEPVYITMTGVVLADLQDYAGSYPYDFDGLLVDKDELEFDDVKKGERPTQEIRIMNNSSTVMHPNVLHLPPYLSAVVTPDRLPPGHSGKVLFTLDSEKVRDFGLTQTSIYMAKELGEKVQSDKEIGVSAVLLPDMQGVRQENAPQLAISDSVLNISFEGKAKKTGEIVLYNPGHSTLEISSLQMFTSGLKMTLGKRTIAPGCTTKLKVTAYADQLAKVRTRPRVLMITNDPKRPKVVITINAN